MASSILRKGMTMHKVATLMAASAMGCVAALPRALTHGVAPSVRADAQDPKALFEELRRSVEEMRAEQESTINARVDALTSEKINNLNTQITNLETALDTINTRVEQGNVPANIIGDIPGNPDYINNFRAHMRKGDGAPADVQAAMSIGTAADGGYLAPVEWDRSITAAMQQESPIRANSQVITISGQGFSRLYSTGAPGSGWVGETAARPATATPQLATLEFRTGELYANPAITQTALDDAAIDLEAWLRDEVRGEFSRQENIAFLSGDGTNKPYGLLTYVDGEANDARHPLGAIDATVATAALADLVEADDILDLIYSLDAERVTGNSKLYMNRQFEASIRKLKNLNGDYMWQPRMTEAAPSTLNGEPIVHIPGMATGGANGIVALYGDMRQTYLVVDRLGIRVLRDPYTNKPFVMFYTTKRVGGGVQNPEYMKALRLAAA